MVCCNRSWSCLASTLRFPITRLFLGGLGPRYGSVSASIIGAETSHRRCLRAQVFGAGEWAAAKYGRRRIGWRKLHLAVDEGGRLWRFSFLGAQVRSHGA